MTKVSILFLMLLIFSVLSPFSSIAYKEKKSVNWLPIAQVENLMLKESRPILVDVYTTWCVYCKAMDATTWKNDSLQQYITSNFYSIKLNAENKAPIQWEGTEYLFQPKYKVHQLAVKWLRGNMVYPSIVIIPEKGEWQVIPGSRTATELELVLKYYGSKANELVDFETYMQQFSGKWKN